MLVSQEMFSGVVAGSAESVPVLAVPVDGGYQLQIAGSVLSTARGAVRVFSQVDSAVKFVAVKIAPAAKRAVLVQVRIDPGQLF